MRLFTLLTIKLVSILLCSSCLANQTGYTPIIQGSGKFIRNNIQLPAIKKLQVSGIAHVYIKQSNSNELIIEAEDNIMPFLIHTTNADALTIELQNNSLSPTQPINYILKVKTLATIKVSGNAKVICQEGLKLDTLAIAAYDRAFVNVWFNGDKVTALVSNAANLVIGGFAKRQEITINETGVFDGKQLRGSTGTLAITYSGVGSINVHDDLYINMPAKGQAQYVGHPRLNKQVSRYANVTSMQELPP